MLAHNYQQVIITNWSQLPISQKQTHNRTKQANFSPLLREETIPEIIITYKIPTLQRKNSK
jgi:hypothetical protein